MSRTLRQITRHDQLVARLCEGIDREQWMGILPSEAVFCRELKESRTTLRKALSQLTAEDWIVLGGRGKAHTILRRPRRVKQDAPSTLPHQVLLNRSSVIIHRFFATSPFV